MTKSNYKIKHNLLVSRFSLHCTKAVYAWFENAPLGGFKEATEQLRITILQFRG